MTEQARTWATWEAHFKPYSSLIAEMGFDEIADRIMDALTEDGCELVSRWGECDLSGAFDKIITLTVDEGRALMTPPEMGINSRLRTIEEFQMDVGQFLADLGLSGHVISQRSVNLAQDDGDGDDDE